MTAPHFKYLLYVRFLQSTQIISGHTTSCYTGLHWGRDSLIFQEADTFIGDKRQMHVKKNNLFKK